MNKVKGFIIYDKKSGRKLAILPLTVPIGSMVQAYEEAGQSVTWGWTEGESE